MLNHSPRWSLNMETILFLQACFYPEMLSAFLLKSPPYSTFWLYVIRRNEVPSIQRLFSTSASILTRCIVLHLDYELTKEQSGKILCLNPNILNTSQFERYICFKRHGILRSQMYALAYSVSKYNGATVSLSSD